MAEKLVLQPNVPEVIALQFTQGKTVPSIYGGPEVMFTLADGRVMFLKPAEAEKIYEAGVAARKPFEAMRKKLAGGAIDFVVRTQNDAAAASSRDAAARTTTMPAKELPSQNSNGNSPAPPPPTTQATPASRRMMGALIAAIDAITEAQIYAKRRGLELELIGEDVRCLASTIYIQEAKEGR